ncbi:glycogen debranching enzyme [Longilinea arvoryzae]|uniref:Glycogen debranching enzyme n=1 Tax=Longilinea arvoryzae TaxID=360412 RepID=A0A0S7BHT0_9CHLR|nr:glycosyl hydrolase family 65 protein [Longilinea arvoryzae]GAP13698.1 glycogen debranching enzyme [Longilinea arvoryzae]
MIQQLHWGEIQQKRFSAPDTMFANTGRWLYVIGDIDGNFRPRSNPYDLYAFGKPQVGDPLANRLQGVWAQPVKALNGYTFIIESVDDIWPLVDAERFTQTFADVQFEYRRGALTAFRTDFVPKDRPALFTTLTMRNDGTRPIDVWVKFFAYFDLRDAQFTTLGDQPNHGETVQVKGERLVARALRLPKKWAIAIGGAVQSAEVRVTTGQDGHPVGVMKYAAHLEPGAVQAWTIAVVVEMESGAARALKNLEDWLPLRESLLAEKQAQYADLLTCGPRFHSPDAHFNAAFDLARANLQMLEAESRALGRFFYAGLQTFPFWFSADGSYDIQGLLAARFVQSGKNHLQIGAKFDLLGSVPHQRSPSGAIAVNGNAAETPLWVISLWEAYRWTGDRAFLESVYPNAVQGLLEYTLGKLDPSADGYPSGSGLIEREDMGAKKLDSAAYTWAALRALENMASAMGDTATEMRARTRKDRLATGFDAAWWNPAENCYSMSLNESDNSQQPVPHWAVIVPLEVGLASPEHAATTFTTLQAKYMNQWGLKHTVGSDERVWTLPTATLSRAAYRYGQAELGFQMLQQLSTTLDYGSIGMFHELIPDGLSFLQLWSGATFLRGTVEDLMGVQVRADLHAVRVAPQLPVDWEMAELEKLNFGGHTITVDVTRTRLTVNHLSGPDPLTVTYQSPDGSERSMVVEAGNKVQW